VGGDSQVNDTTYQEVVRRTLHGGAADREEISLLHTQIENLRKLRAMDEEIVRKLTHIIAAQDATLKRLRGVAATPAPAQD
jgi:hypothetical protein